MRQHAKQFNTKESAVSYLAIVFLAMQLASAVPSPDVDVVEKYRAAATERWQADIEALEELDKREADPEHAILFLGSSSIRRWEEMPQDMAPWSTIRRGYGGAKLSDLGVFANRLVRNHSFQALVIFVGNDISGKPEDKAPEEVLKLFENVVATVRVTHSTQPIFFIAITPTPSRFHVWAEIQKANQLIQDFCKPRRNLYFIETAAAILDESGRPKEALFLEDQLHLNRDGYRLWAGTIKSRLEDVLPPLAGDAP